MISLQEALDSYPKHLKPLGTETVPTTRSLHRCLAAPAAARIDLPRFTQSAVDGYALIATDTDGASNTAPVTMPIAGELAAGPVAARPSMRRGQAWRVLTGSLIPEGADTVIPQELVRPMGSSITMTAPFRPDRNIRHLGEELRSGEAIAASGRRITAGLLAALVMAGTTEVVVRRQPRISVLVTGDELREPGSVLGEGEIFDSNGPLVESWLVSQGYAVAAIGRLPDERERVASALRAALDASELVITTGGASVGDRDFIPAVSQELGVQQVFWKVSQKPGKPMLFGTRGDTALLALPGNPGAVLVSLVLHLRAVLDCLEGSLAIGAPFQSGVLAADVRADKQRDRLVRMIAGTDNTGSLLLTPLGRQESHMLSNLAAANALAHLPARDSDYAAGSVVRWTPLPGICSI